MEPEPEPAGVFTERPRTMPENQEEDDDAADAEEGVIDRDLNLALLHHRLNWPCEGWRTEWVFNELRCLLLNRPMKLFVKIPLLTLNN